VLREAASAAARTCATRDSCRVTTSAFRHQWQQKMKRAQLVVEVPELADMPLARGTLVVSASTTHRAEASAKIGGTSEGVRAQSAERPVISGGAPSAWPARQAERRPAGDGQQLVISRRRDGTPSGPAHQPAPRCGPAATGTVSVTGYRPRSAVGSSPRRRPAARGPPRPGITQLARAQLGGVDVL